MVKKEYSFSSSTVAYYFDADFSLLEKLVDKERAIIITDENVAVAQKRNLKSWKLITIAAGEVHKNQQTVNNIIEQLIKIGADRKSILIGVGGGVVTDITGFVAAIYMRGIQFAFVPTTILAMVDAAIGGKNGVDVGLYKNMIGLIRQPKLLLYDYSLLKTLPKEEWVNGFAEIIKHACIKDATMFAQLQQHKINHYRKDITALAALVKRNALLKTKVVQSDEFELGDRKLLNFGHTVGHAIENLYSIPHGHAVSIGIGVACQLSSAIFGFKDTDSVTALLKQYGLPPAFDFDKKETIRILKSDKKKDNTNISFILLNRIGKATIHTISFDDLEKMIEAL